MKSLSPKNPNQLIGRFFRVIKVLKNHFKIQMFNREKLVEVKTVRNFQHFNTFPYSIELTVFEVMGICPKNISLVTRLLENLSTAKYEELKGVLSDAKRDASIL